MKSEVEIRKAIESVKIDSALMEAHGEESLASIALSAAAALLWAVDCDDPLAARFTKVLEKSRDVSEEIKRTILSAIEEIDAALGVANQTDVDKAASAE